MYLITEIYFETHIQNCCFMSLCDQKIDAECRMNINHFEFHLNTLSKC